MDDNKLILSLAIVVIVLFGVFMLLTNEEQEQPTIVMGNDLSEPVQAEVQESIEDQIPVFEQAELNNVEEEILTELEEIIEEPEVVVEEAIIEEMLAVDETNITPEPEVPILPILNNSDDFVKEKLLAMDGGSPLLRHLVSEELVRKFVIMVENISRGEFPEQNLPILNPAERMSVTELGSNFYLMDELSYQRFNDLVAAVTNISTENAVNFYQQLKPLLQEAYAELGIRNSEFTDVFFQAIDAVLNARTAPQPQQLIRPNLNFLYADPEIENYTDVEKLLLRLGPENTENLQRRLEFFKRRLELDASLDI